MKGVEEGGSNNAKTNPDAASKIAFSQDSNHFEISGVTPAGDSDVTCIKEFRLISGEDRDGKIHRY